METSKLTNINKHYKFIQFKRWVGRADVRNNMAINQNTKKINPKKHLNVL
jgi:hypothetical protein